MNSASDEWIQYSEAGSGLWMQEMNTNYRVSFLKKVS